MAAFPSRQRALPSYAEASEGVPSEAPLGAKEGYVDSACMTSPNSSQVSPLKRESWTAWIG